jgi:multidrug efflux pump subunit AcrA (membrane-fusion protein)
VAISETTTGCNGPLSALAFITAQVFIKAAQVFIKAAQAVLKAAQAVLKAAQAVLKAAQALLKAAQAVPTRSSCFTPLRLF